MESSLKTAEYRVPSLNGGHNIVEIKISSKKPSPFKPKKKDLLSQMQNAPRDTFEQIYSSFKKSLDYFMKKSKGS